MLNSKPKNIGEMSANSSAALPPLWRQSCLILEVKQKRLPVMPCPLEAIPRTPEVSPPGFMKNRDGIIPVEEWV